jgi:hypothetical protein
MCPFYGPYDGKLDNSGESVRLYRPTPPKASRFLTFSWTVDYSHALPWPAAADGIGPTLQKLTESAYGNDALNWVAVGPSPGSPRVPGGSPPTVTTQPANTAVLAGNPAFFSVTATGTAPLYYQWRYKGANIPGAVFSTFTLPGVQTSQAGPYSVIVYNSAGSTESSNGVLTVLIPASITLHPTNALVRIKPDPLALPNTNGAFYASASSTTLLRYQWQRSDGITFTNIGAGTNSTLVVTNVQLESAGDYRCANTDDVGSIYTQPAKLIPLVTPVIVQPPLAQTVPAGGLVSLSVALGVGNPPPFYYEWRRGSLVIGTFITDSKSNVFTFLAQSNLASQQYRLIVTNLATTNIQAVAIAVNVTTIADNDRDGLPDEFEVSIGLNTNNMADAETDLDGDTMSNLEEYVAGTDPTNPPATCAWIIRRSGNDPAPGRRGLEPDLLGAIQRRPRPCRNQHVIKHADIPAQGVNHVETLAVPNTLGHRFWRLAVPGTN